jgi:transcriptional regulator with PAS, ATPase and Fis domain
MPPLREREGDVELLATYFLRQLSSEYDTEKTLGADALDVLKRHSWPGNVRELKNVLNRAFIVAGREITASCLPPLHHPGGDIDEGADGLVVVSGDTVTVRAGSTTLASTEKKLIQVALEKYDGDKKRAAKSLGISVRTLYNRLKEYRDDSE